MTISISRNQFWDIFFEDEPSQQQCDPHDEFDICWQFPSQFGAGYSREIELRDGLGLLMSDRSPHLYRHLRPSLQIQCAGAISIGSIVQKLIVHGLV